MVGKINCKNIIAKLMVTIVVVSNLGVIPMKVEASASAAQTEYFFTVPNGEQTAYADSNGELEVDFSLPNELNTYEKLKAAGINSVTVEFSVSKFTAESESTVGVQSYAKVGNIYSGDDCPTNWVNLPNGS